MEFTGLPDYLQPATQLAGCGHSDSRCILKANYELPLGNCNNGEEESCNSVSVIDTKEIIHLADGNNRVLDEPSRGSCDSVHCGKVTGCYITGNVSSCEPGFSFVANEQPILPTEMVLSPQSIEAESCHDGDAVSAIPPQGAILGSEMSSLQLSCKDCSFIEETRSYFSGQRSTEAVAYDPMSPEQSPAVVQLKSAAPNEHSGSDTCEDEPSVQQSVGHQCRLPAGQTSPSNSREYAFQSLQPVSVPMQTSTLQEQEPANEVVAPKQRKLGAEHVRTSVRAAATKARQLCKLPQKGQVTIPGPMTSPKVVINNLLAPRPRKSGKKKKRTGPPPGLDNVSVCRVNGVPCCKVLAGLLNLDIVADVTPVESKAVECNPAESTGGARQGEDAQERAQIPTSSTEDDSHPDPTNEELQLHSLVEPKPACGCLKPNEAEEGPCYTQLGTAATVQELRELMESRTGVKGKAMRVEKLRYTGKAAKTSTGCPVAKWVLKRSSTEEKVLICVRQRPKHTCNHAWMIIAVVCWEGVPESAANHLYSYLTRTLPVYGYETERRCGYNDRRTCACQGFDCNRYGASFSYGCSWSVYHDACKFARSDYARKFKLREECLEETLESKMNVMSQYISPMLNEVAPKAYANQVKYEYCAKDCRLGYKEGRPFSGVTATVDFCAHGHYDMQNMQNGCTVLVTLTKQGAEGNSTDRQFHVLPLYIMDDVSADIRKPQAGASLLRGRESNPLDTVPLGRKIDSGLIEVRTKQVIEVRSLKQPAKKVKKTSEKYPNEKVREVAEEALQLTKKMLRLENTEASRGTAAARGEARATSSRVMNSIQAAAETKPGLLLPRLRAPSPEVNRFAAGAMEEDCARFFEDPNIGGVGLELTHGSVLFEVAEREQHASTALSQPDRYDPTRISLVFYQHKKLNYRAHGKGKYKTMEKTRLEAQRIALMGGKPYIPKSLKYKRRREREAAMSQLAETAAKSATAKGAATKSVAAKVAAAKSGTIKVPVAKSGPAKVPIAKSGTVKWAAAKPVTSKVAAAKCSTTEIIAPKPLTAADVMAARAASARARYLKRTSAASFSTVPVGGEGKAQPWLSPVPSKAKPVVNAKSAIDKCWDATPVMRCETATTTSIVANVVTAVMRITGPYHGTMSYGGPIPSVPAFSWSK